jgi:catechol 2,3-dioxygenase-like lactoylglutathione lyase family enzyme
MLEKVDHVTMVVKDLDAALKTFNTVLHVSPDDKGGFRRDFPEARIAMLPTKNGARIELIEPNINVNSRFTEFLKRRGEGVYGICMYMSDYEKEISGLEKQGVPTLHDKQTRLFPDYPFNITWVPEKEGHGVWLELINIKEMPDFEL